MFKKLLSIMMLTIAGCLAALGANPPVISTGDQITWYALKFLNGGGVLEAQAEDAEVKTAALTGKDTQLWKVEGNEEEGYTLTSKNGMKLFTTTTAKNGMFKSATQPSSENTRFVWSETTSQTYAGGYVLSPKANTAVFMNQWGGAGTGKSLGLWDNKADDNQPFEFVQIKDLIQKHALIPYPKSLKEGEGRLKVTDLTGIFTIDETTRRYASEFAAQLKRTMGSTLPVDAAAKPAGIAMVMKTDASLKHEGYTLKISAEGIEIASADSTGFFYALQTLKQLLPNAIYGKVVNEKADWSLPCLEIADEPQLGHRGFMLDIARHFFSKTEVKRVLDVMASYKMNRFHWHLTDDQGWRVQIPEYPLLTEVGSIRAGSFTNAGGSEKFIDDTEYGHGMWYSLDDLREIVAYAKARNIEIMPEIDLPGHMVAAVASYPELSCDPTKKYEVRIDGGISHDVLNIGKDETIDFLKCVLGHIAEVFPFPYIHIGGDECPTDQWKNNPECLNRVKEQGLKGVEELQSWLVEHLGEYLKEKYNKDIVVWDELLAHWNKNNKVKPVVMAWNSIGHSAKAADFGLKSIVVPYQTLYLDFMQVEDDKADVNEGYQGGWGPTWVNTVEEAYTINPVASLQGREDFCIGVQGNLWTETCSDSIQLEYQLLPRMLALSETGWKPTAEKEWLGFYNRLQSHDEILDLMGYTFAKHYFEPAKLTDTEAAAKEAASILDASKPGEVGYPSQEEYNKLKAALDALDEQEDKDGYAETLNQAIDAYKKADIKQPEAGKTYQIVSASTYFKAKYAGSTAYAAGNNIRFHYTPQTEPEELWQFTPKDKGFVMTNLLNGKQVKIPNKNGDNVTLEQEGSTVRIDLATKPSKQYTYVPGSVTISNVTGYTSSPKRFYGHASGFVKAESEGAICYPGTWYIREVKDFTAQLAGLVKKGQRAMLTAKPGEMGQPTQDALDFLANQILTPASAAVKEGNVSEEVYKKYMNLYKEFLAMPRTSPAEGIDENFCYLIRNAHFTEYYAAVNSNGNIAPKKLAKDNEDFYWIFKKNADGTVTLTNKGNGKTAYPQSEKEDAKMMTGKAYNWTLEEITTDQNKTGIAFVDATGTYSWYTNPSNWKENIIFKPKNWGASIWTLEKLDINTGITDVTAPAAKEVKYYDLQGRRVLNPTHGIYITSDGRKVMK